MTLRPTFAVTWDYRCPFARNGHEHVLGGLEAGAPWDVTFVPFFLNQSHVPEGGTPAWDDPAQQADLWPWPPAWWFGTGSRRSSPPCTARCSPPVTTTAATSGMWPSCGRPSPGPGPTPTLVLAEVETGWPAKVVRDEHDRVVSQLDVFGVPTFIADESAVFVRLMNRPLGDGTLARGTVDGILDLITTIPNSTSSSTPA